MECNCQINKAVARKLMDDDVADIDIPREIFPFGIVTQIDSKTFGAELGVATFDFYDSENQPPKGKYDAEHGRGKLQVCHRGCRYYHPGDGKNSRLRLTETQRGMMGPEHCEMDIFEMRVKRGETTAEKFRVKCCPGCYGRLTDVSEGDVQVECGLLKDQHIDHLRKTCPISGYGLVWEVPVPPPKPTVTSGLTREEASETKKAKKNEKRRRMREYADKRKQEAEKTHAPQEQADEDQAQQEQAYKRKKQSERKTQATAKAAEAVAKAAGRGAHAAAAREMMSQFNPPLPSRTRGEANMDSSPWKGGSRQKSRMSEAEEREIPMSNYFGVLMQDATGVSGEMGEMKVGDSGPMRGGRRSPVIRSHMQSHPYQGQHSAQSAP